MVICLTERKYFDFYNVVNGIAVDNNGRFSRCLIQLMVIFLDYFPLSKCTPKVLNRKTIPSYGRQFA